MDAQEVLQLILEHTPDPIIITDKHGRVVEINEAALADFCLSRNEAVGAHLDDVSSKGGHSVFSDDFEVLQDKIDWLDQRNESRKLLKSISVSGTSSRGQELNLVVTQDVTKLERARKQLAEREATLRVTLDAVASGLWELTPASGELKSDEKWLEIFGLDADSHDGTVTVFDEVLHPDDRDTIFQKIHACLQGFSDGYVSEYRIVRKDGQTIWVRDSGKVVERSRDGRAKRLVGAVVDITNLKNHQEELELRRRDAEMAADAKSQFLANMSHELRTPMNGVMGMLDSLLETSLDTEQRDMAKMALNSAEGLLNILNDILDTSKLEAGAIELELIPVDINMLAKELECMFQNLVRDKSILFKIDVQSDSPLCIIGDPTRLRQVLVNLVGNAIKFTDHGIISLNVVIYESMLRFEVEDTGIGIPKHACATLFDRFTQADVSTTRKFGGTGLGLAIAHQLVELMGGQLCVKSVLGEGSCFYFQIPLRRSYEAKAVESAKAPEVNLAALSILVAEDVLVNQLVVRRMLERQGHEVTLVENGREAVEAVESGSFDLILMDVHMPEMDGIQATKQIRALNSRTSEVPIIALTANAMKGDRERYLEAGMNEYTTKPIQRGHLFSCIQKVLLPEG